MKLAIPLGLVTATAMLSACAGMSGSSTTGSGQTAAATTTTTTTTTAKPQKSAIEQSQGLRSRESAYGPYRMD